LDYGGEINGYDGGGCGGGSGVVNGNIMLSRLERKTMR